MADLSALAAEERRDLADYLGTLTDSEWSQPSLCPGWSVRDVVGHIASYDVLGWPATLGLLARSGFSLARANAAGVAASASLSRSELVSRLRECAEPRGITRGFGCAIALTDGIIHQQDIRRALGHPRTVPSPRLLAALSFLPRARVLPSPGNLRGIRVVATDVAWSHGSGPSVRGPGEALLLALAGRPVALRELSGPGLAVLAARVEG